MPTLSLCSQKLSRLFFGEPRLTSDGGAIYFGDEAVSHLAAITKGMNVLLMIPGFNNSDSAAQESFNTITQTLTSRKILGPGCAYDVAIGLEWPGRTAVGYCLAETSARKTADKLREIVAQLKPLTLDLECHSLGNLVGLHANRDGALRVRNAVLCNAAVGERALEDDQGYYQAAWNMAGKCLIVYSKHDEVLGRDYRWLGSVPRNILSFAERKGGGFGENALGFSGPKDPKRIPLNCIPLDATEWCPSHGAARSAPQLYDAWENVLKLGEKKP